MEESRCEGSEEEENTHEPQRRCHRENNRGAVVFQARGGWRPTAICESILKITHRNVLAPP